MIVACVLFKVGVKRTELIGTSGVLCCRWLCCSSSAGQTGTFVVGMGTVAVLVEFAVDSGDFAGGQPLEKLLWRLLRLTMREMLLHGDRRRHLQSFDFVNILKLENT